MKLKCASFTSNLVQITGMRKNAVKLMNDKETCKCEQMCEHRHSKITEHLSRWMGGCTTILIICCRKKKTVIFVKVTDNVSNAFYFSLSLLIYPYQEAKRRPNQVAGQDAELHGDGRIVHHRQGPPDLARIAPDKVLKMSVVSSRCRETNITEFSAYTINMPRTLPKK